MSTPEAPRTFMYVIIHDPACRIFDCQACTCKPDVRMQEVKFVSSMEEAIQDRRKAIEQELAGLRGHADPDLLNALEKERYRLLRILRGGAA